MWALDVAKQLNTDIYKKIFKIKPPDAKGLLVNILQSSTRKSTRFIHSDFHSTGNVLALANNDGHIYLIDFATGKFWKLPQLDSCVYIKLSEYNDSHILIAKANGVVEILNIDSGDVLAKLLGHQHPVISISFTQSSTCVSSSKFEAIIWDLRNFNKMHVLSLEKNCALKFVLFVPISNHILVCYKDDIIQIWQHGSYKNMKQFHPSNWRNYSVRSISFSRNGKIMAISGYLPVLAIFQLDIWKLIKIITLPEYINTVKKIQFISNSFDGGCNKLLAILSGTGIVYFYNIEEDVLISELKTKCKISNFSMPNAVTQYITCLLCSGEVEIYDINFFTLKNQKTDIKRARDVSDNKKGKLRNYSKKVDISAKIQMDQILESDKLKTIIKEYQEFPEAFRSTIWEKILKLPNNIKQYNNIVNHIGIMAFEDLQEQFPLEDKVTIRCLRHLLNNIATWCPFFAQVDFLPCFLFPFVKVFHTKPIACFELCCTVIVNWCQHWFEYHPLPPVNVLAIIDNMLMEHDAAALELFARYKVQPVLYSWLLLETAFSEVLTAPEWLKFWDHVFVNEPSFLLCAVVAFIMVQKKYLLLLTKEEEFRDFFHTPKPLDIKKFIHKTYYILNNTSNKNHPRQYLNMFACLTCGTYPVFEEYPKNVVNFQVEHINHLESQLKETKSLKKQILKEKQRQQKCSDFELKNEEDKRMIEVEKACIEKIKAYQQNLISQQEELRTLRQELTDQEAAIIQNTKQKHLLQGTAEKMKLLTDGIRMGEQINKIEINNLEEAYKLEALNLSRRSKSPEEDDGGGQHLSPSLANQLSSAHKETVYLKNQIKKAKIDLESPRKADIALTISSMNSLISQIKSELEKDVISSNYDSVKENLKVHELEKQTKHLQKEISQLLNVLTNKRDTQEYTPTYSNRTLYNKGPTCSNRTVRFLH